MNWIQTLDGRAFNLDSPSAADVHPHTIAVVLARQCRFGNHCTPFYSTAQHSVSVALTVERHDPRLALPALLHDAHEVYSGFGDVLRPAKQMCEYVRDWLSGLEYAIDAAIAERFGFDQELFYDSRIKEADDAMLATEKRDLLLPEPLPWAELPEPLPGKIRPWGISQATAMFELRLCRYLSERSKGEVA